MFHCLRPIVFGLTVAAVPTAAMAADPGPGRFGPVAKHTAPSADWTVTIGAEGRVMPSWVGAHNNYVVRPVPWFDIRRAGSHESFRAPRDGISFALYDTGAFRVGPTGKLRMQRKESDGAALRGLGDVDWAVELGGFAEYWWMPWLRTRAEVRHGIGGHHGVTADLTADAVVRVTPQLTVSGGPRLSLASSAANNPYYSINSVQSVASGLPSFDARGGMSSVGAGVQARYFWTPQWATHVFVEYERLTGDVANSPLVSQRGSKDHTTYGFGATYSFDMRALW